MRVGPINIEKEDDYQQWRVSLSVQRMNYYTHWYSSHLHTKQEAIEKFMLETTADVWGGSLHCADILEIFEQAKVALLFLAVEEQE